MSTTADSIHRAGISTETLLRAYELMCTAREMTLLYEERFSITSKYVHATSRGHEAVQIATGLLLKAQDYLSAYYRDDSMMLAIGMRPYELMLQLMAKRDDPFETYKALLEGDIKDARDLDGRIPEGIAGLLEACLARDPAERPADGRALLARVERAIPRPSFFARIFGGEFDPAALSRRTADRAAAGMRA